MLQQRSQILTPRDLAGLRGADIPGGLDQEGFYVQVFLLNDKQNRAVQPEPFKIATEALDRISRTAIGRPLIVWPGQKIFKRHFDADGGSPEAVLRLQQRYAIGEIVGRVINTQTHNVSAIVKIFPEYVDMVRQGRIPPYVSPMIEVFDRDELSDEIMDGRVIHLHAVDQPGYGQIAKISAKCDGMLGQCMNKMRVLAAAGRLREYQRSLEDDNDHHHRVVDYDRIFQAIGRGGRFV